jgi:broad specificity phosphatase PhoE
LSALPAGGEGLPAPCSMRIYFVRHGESQANLLQEISNRGLRHGLTRHGREQAVALADWLRDQRITHIYSSPLLRAIETAVILANRLEIDYEVVDALREYDCGIAEGRSDAEAWQLWQALFDAWLVDGRWAQRIEGGESFYELRERFLPFIEELVSRYGNTEARILCVSHGGVYCAMLPLVLVNVDNRRIVDHGFDPTSCLVSELRPAGLYCVEWTGSVIGGKEDRGR